MLLSSEPQDMFFQLFFSPSSMEGFTFIKAQVLTHFFFGTNLSYC